MGVGKGQSEVSLCSPDVRISMSESECQEK